jgi:hypothetical protein
VLAGEQIWHMCSFGTHSTKADFDEAITFALSGCTAAAARSANQLPLVTSVSFWSRSVGDARSMLGQNCDDDIARVEQDGFLLVRRDLDEAKSSEQKNSFNS